MFRYFSRRALVVAAAAAALSLTACDIDETSTPTSVADITTSTTHATSTPELTDDRLDQIFLQVIAEYGLGGQKAIDAARATCEALDAGVPAQVVALTAIESLGDPEKAGALLGAGVETYCPEHSDDLANLGGGADA